MNKKRRTKIQEAIHLVTAAHTIVEFVKDLEEDALDNVPENLQAGERYERMEETVDTISDIAEQLQDISAQLRGLM